MTIEIYEPDSIQLRASTLEEAALLVQTNERSKYIDFMQFKLETAILPNLTLTVALRISAKSIA